MPEDRVLADRVAIIDLLHRYCRAMDRIDPAACHSLWHEDSVVDYGEFFQGSGHAFTEHVCTVHRALVATSHQVTSVILDLDGGRAGSEAYFFASMRFHPGDEVQQISVWGRYVDRWSRRNDRWGIDKRITLIDFDEIRQVTPVSRSSRSTRDRSDPSYGVLRGG